MRKIFYNENPIIDLSNITVTPETLFSGSRCLNSNGEIINGTVVPLENTAEFVKVYVATNHDTYGATGKYTFEFTYADDNGVHTVSCKNGDNSYVMLPTNSVIVEKCDAFSSLGFTQQAANTSSSITTLYSHAIRDSFPYVMFYVTGEGTLCFYTSDQYILWSGNISNHIWNKYSYDITLTSGNSRSCTSVWGTWYSSYTIEGDIIKLSGPTTSITTKTVSAGYDEETGEEMFTSEFYVNGSKVSNYPECSSAVSGMYKLGTGATSTGSIISAGSGNGDGTLTITAKSQYVLVRAGSGINYGSSMGWYIMHCTPYTVNSYTKTSHGTVSSSNRNAYPDNGVLNGYKYVYSSGTSGYFEYYQLSAIQATGTQYIDTGLVANKSDTYEILLDAQLTNNANYAGANGYLQYQANVAGGTRANIKISYNGSTCVENIYVNNVLKTTENWTSSYNGANVKIGIFALGDANNSWWSGGNPQSGTVYSVKITKSGVLVRDFVPAQSNSGVVGLFDKCNNVFYANAGSGTFTAIA